MISAVIPDWKRRYLVLAPPLVVALFVMVLLATMTERFSSTREVQQTYQLLASVHRLEARLVDAETGQRGYLITGDTSYLGPYRGAELDARQLVAELAGTARRDTAQYRLAAEIGRVVRDRLAIMALPVARRGESFEAARAQLIAGRGRQSMEQLRALIRQFEARETARLDGELARQRLTGFVAVFTVLFGALVVVAVSLLTRRQFRSYEQHLETANTELAELNELLQQQATELELQAQELEMQTVELQENAAELEESNAELTRQRQLLEDQALELETANDELHASYQIADESRLAAERANQAKTRFLTSMSHELRTPLNAIGGYVDLLQLGVHGPLTEQQRSCLDRIRHNGSHLLVLINDILDYAKIQAGRVEMRSRDTALGELIAETQELVRPLLQAKAIDFVSPTSLDGLSVHGDPDRIRQILLNLLSNAAKYTDDGGSVAIALDADQDRVRIHVHDTGWGIPGDMQNHIFEPFVQLGRSDGQLTDGVGLGLSISRELAAAMDGDLSVQSEPGQGSTFTLTLRRAPAAHG